MKVRSLSGKEATLSTNRNTFPMKSREACKSQIQYDCGQFLLEKFPFDPILEEVSVPHENLSIDFLIPSRKLAFEIQGRQHDKYVPFFHKSPQNFLASKERDSRKQKWCEINGITLYHVDSLESLRNLF